MEPLVSIIMPAYNSGNTISRAIQSVLDQTYSEFELLVIDDGSTDNTVDIVNFYIKTDSRIVLLRNPRNLGVAASRNHGCRMAQGEYLAFLDSDDMWFEDKLEKQVSFMLRKGCDLSCTAYAYAHPHEQPSRDKRAYRVPESISYEQLLKENVIGCSTVMLKATALNGHAFCGDYAHEDYVLWLELAKAGKTLCGLDEVLTGYSYGGRSANKFKAGKNRWIIYRRAQKLSLPKALYYMACYILNAIRKYKSLRKD